MDFPLKWKATRERKVSRIPPKRKSSEGEESTTAEDEENLRRWENEEARGQ